MHIVHTLVGSFTSCTAC